MREHEPGLTHRELMLANEIVTQGRALIIAANKVDALPKARRAAALDRIRHTVDHGLPAGSAVRILPIAAQAGRVDALLPAVHDIYRMWNQRVPTGQLNRIVRKVRAVCVCGCFGGVLFFDYLCPHFAMLSPSRMTMHPLSRASGARSNSY